MWRLYRLHLLIHSFLKKTNPLIWLAEIHTVWLINDLSCQEELEELGNLCEPLTYVDEDSNLVFCPMQVKDLILALSHEEKIKGTQMKN